ncbi:hypothetical protein TNCV_3414491 [Trichonephila clavipes]|uniref:Uncharacterized protein n=1 Tax=Trichonephila clavipes TaxID=2585209 RepID=A0A8X6RK44_TRICX|nr:hypothetical protein TNCV_3414491 [Trichonephila clavipes]
MLQVNHNYNTYKRLFCGSFKLNEKTHYDASARCLSVYRMKARQQWTSASGSGSQVVKEPVTNLYGTFPLIFLGVFLGIINLRIFPINSKRPVNWPPRSCDLTPLDYFLWGYVKSLVYADKPQTLDHLEDNIRRVIADIRPQMLEKVIENWTSRLDYIRASRGSPMREIIFKM